MTLRFMKPAVTAIACIAFLGHGCSRDPLRLFYEHISGPYSEWVGPYHRITFMPGPDRYPAWSRDGTQILYSAQGFEVKSQGKITVNVIPYSGGISRRISPVFGRTRKHLYPSWTNSDRQVAYIAIRSYMEPALCVVSVDDMSDFSEYVIGLHSPLDLAVSPDGNSLVYSDFLEISGYDDTGHGRTGEEFIYPRERWISDSWTCMWSAELPFSGEKERVFGTEGAQGLCWSPYADSIAYSKDGFIYVASPTGGGVRELFEGESPAWSPDGTQMACVIDSNVYVYRMSDGHRSQITTDGGLDPAWSPDGRKLAFSWAMDGGDWNFDIYVVALDEFLCR